MTDSENKSLQQIAAAKAAGLESIDRIMAVLQDSTDEELILIAELLEKFHRDHRK